MPTGKWRNVHRSDPARSAARGTGAREQMTEAGRSADAWMVAARSASIVPGPSIGCIPWGTHPKGPLRCLTSPEQRVLQPTILIVFTGVDGPAPGGAPPKGPGPDGDRERRVPQPSPARQSRDCPRGLIARMDKHRPPHTI